MRLWDSLDAREHEYQYNPQISVPDFKSFQARREQPNASARARLRCAADIAYGSHPLHGVDVYPAANAGAPVHMFFHGGYWRMQDKRNFAFIAGALVDAGICAVIVNYALCPDVTLDGVVGSALLATEWTVRNIAAYGGDPARVTLSGHSAGAHERRRRYPPDTRTDRAARLRSASAAHPLPDVDRRRRTGALALDRPVLPLCAPPAAAWRRSWRGGVAR
jgi:hypothetical protein